MCFQAVSDHLPAGPTLRKLPWLPRHSRHLPCPAGESLMLGIALVIVGIALMAVGLVFLGGWVNGRGERAGRPGSALSDRSKADRQIMDLYFIAIVVAPLLAGAMLIAFGLGMVLG